MKSPGLSSQDQERPYGSSASANSDFANTGPDTGKCDPAKGDLLVIGCGNTLRNDDGVGQCVAERIEQMALRGVRSIGCHQLTPELADSISKARKVFFVDASIEPGSRVQMRLLEAAPSSQILTHAADPRTLLALSRDVYGHCPPAWWLTIPVQNLDFGGELSTCAKAGLESAVRFIETLAAD